MKNKIVSDVIEMCSDIRRLHNDNYFLSKRNFGLERKIEVLEDQISEYEKKLKIVSGIICKHIDHSEGGRLYISSMWEFESDNDFKNMIDTLEIPLTESEIRENE